MKNNVFLILLLAGILILSPSKAESFTVERVIDGDTFVLSDGEKVRIIGIDAPEDDGNSTQHLKNMIADQTVILEFEGEKRDKYSRLLAYVRLNDSTDVGARMVKDGFALVYVKYPCSRTDEYLILEREARAAGRGVWSAHFRSTKPGPQNEVKTTTNDSGSITVYATRTGKKYHRGSCRHLKKSKIPMSLADAATRYGPCGVCSPPVVSTESKNLSPQKQPKPESIRCAATTKKGTRCKRKVSAGSSYCWQHK